MRFTSGIQEWANGVRLRLPRASPPGYYGNNRITKSEGAQLRSPDGPSGLDGCGLLAVKFFNVLKRKCQEREIAH